MIRNSVAGLGSLLVSLAMAGCASPEAGPQGAIDKIKERGYVSCGASQGIPGLSRPDEQGIWRGFDSDICRAFAAAVLGDAEKIRFVPLNAAQRLPAVQTGEIDVLSRTTTVTFTRDMAIRFVAVTLYDSDAVIVRNSDGITEAKQLDGRTVCMQGGGSLVENALDEMEEEQGIKVNRVYFDSTITARDTFFAGRCDTYVTDGLAARASIAAVAKNPADYSMIYIGHTVEPNGVAIPRGDDRWFDVIRWTVNLLVWAEQNGITQANVDEMAATGPAHVRRLLGEDGAYGQALGLPATWARNVIKEVGNYGEIWDRNLGEGSPIKAERRLNNQYNEGGLLFALPWA